MRNELKIGWMLLIAILLVFGFLSWLKRAFVSNQYVSYEIHFHDVSGLQTGDPVTLLGREVGYVSGFRAPGTDTIGWIVIADISPDAHIGKRAIASLRLREITGGRRIDIESAALENNSMTSVIQGQTAWDAGMALQEIQKLASFSQDENLKAFVIHGAQAMEKLNNGDWNQNFQDGIALMQQTHKTLTMLQPILMYLQTDADLPALLGTTHNTLKTIQTLADSLKPFLSSQLLYTASNTLTRTDTLIQSTQQFLDNATPVLKALTPQEASAAQLVFNNQEFALQMQQIALRLDSVLRLIQEGKIKARVRI